MKPQANSAGRRSVFFRTILPVLGLSLLACQHKETDFKPRQGDGPVFHASIEQVDAPDNRVYADENHRLRWHAGDMVSIFNKNSYNQKYQFDGETGDYSGTFTRIGSEVFGVAFDGGFFELRKVEASVQAFHNTS